MRQRGTAGAGILQSLRQTDRRAGVAAHATASAFSAFNTVGSVILYVLANTFFARLNGLGAPQGGSAFLRPLLSTVAILLLAKAACGFVAGWGLLQREHWARIAVLVLAFVSLFTNIPFGTALGIYTMWVLLPAESEREYDAVIVKRAA